MKTLLLLIFLVSAHIGFSQDYTVVDSIVNNYPEEFESIKNFAAKIDSDFTSDIDKTRAAFYWVSNHIEYDYQSANSPRISDNLYTYNDETQLEDIQREYAENVLRTKSAVCEGYSQLLKFTLTELQIKCEVISGYAKTEITEIGKIKSETNHAWNAVFLNNKWQLMDATWSTENFLKKENAYFLIKPENLILSHFPEAKKWQLLKKPISKFAFFYGPIIHYGLYSSGLKLTKNLGIVKVGDLLHISFDTIDEDQAYYYNYSESNPIAKPVEFVKSGNKYITKIPYKYKSGRELVIFTDNKPCLSFKID